MSLLTEGFEKPRLKAPLDFFRTYQTPATLDEAGWLELAFYQLASIGNVQALIARKNRKLAAAGS